MVVDKVKKIVMVQESLHQHVMFLAKYVYDSSDFIRYRKLKALNASYVAPDYADGGSNGLGNKNVKYSYDEVYK